MSNYIDGFVFPISKQHIEEYKTIAKQVAEIWKTYGAISYSEFIGDDLFLEGTTSFLDAIDVKDTEVLVFGFVVFPSKTIRNSANLKVPQDSKMNELVAPLMDSKPQIFNPKRMLYGGFKSLV